jgi:hypothetical protein
MAVGRTTDLPDFSGHRVLPNSVDEESGHRASSLRSFVAGKVHED